MRPVDEGRRQTLKLLGGAAALGALTGAGLLRPRRAAAEWNKAAFAAPDLDGVVKVFGGTSATETTDVSWGSTPEIAENGAVVPVNLTSRIPNTESISIVIEKNPNKLAATFHFPEGTAPAISTRVKMSETSKVYALVRTTDEKYFVTSREIKVTLGGCGG